MAAKRRWYDSLVNLGIWGVPALVVLYLLSYQMFGTLYDRGSTEVYRAFASEIALAYQPLGKLEAMIRERSVVFTYRDELPPHADHEIWFEP